MSSTWSNLGINLQGTGDNSGTWGSITNVNLQDFDYAISGVAPIVLSGNTTLAFTTNSSATTYTQEFGRAKILVLSGTLSATTVTVTVPNIQKDYVIVNNSGATVVVSSGGSTTISIGNSINAYIYSNGSSSIFFALPLPVTTNPGGTNTYIQYNSSGSFAGSSNLTFNGTTLAMQTATALNLTSTTENITTANITTANVTTANITTANVTTANITSLTATNATVNSLNITSLIATNATVNSLTATTLTAVTVTSTTEYDSKGEIRLVPIRSTSANYTLQSTDHGTCVSAAGTINVPQNVFSSGQNVTIFNNTGGNITITQNSGVTLYWQTGAGPGTGSRTLASYGLAVVYCVASNVFVISGGGLS
jgi:hypothetical protein